LGNAVKTDEGTQSPAKYFIASTVCDWYMHYNERYCDWLIMTEASDCSVFLYGDYVRAPRVFAPYHKRQH